MRVTLVRPARGQAPIRFGEPLVVTLDLELDEPWFSIPHLGGRVNNLDGEPEPAIAFDTQRPTAVKVLAAGRAEKRDTGVDDHSGPPVRVARAGRGCEVTVTSGGLQITYSHLRRDTARAGVIRMGDAVGQSGNTGRCVNGAKGAFVKVAAKFRGSPRRLEEFTEPITVEATFNGFKLWDPKKVPAGEVKIDNFELPAVTVEQGRGDPERGDIFRSGENELLVTVKRGSRVLASEREVATLEW